MTRETDLPWTFWKSRNPPIENPLCAAANISPDFPAVPGLEYSGKTAVAANPCVSCGACCAFYLVSFPNQEADNVSGGVVSFEMTGRTNNSRRFMKGTETTHPRCTALDGFIGTHVECRIYANRPSTCRNFCRSWEKGVGNFLCDRARAVYGLNAFSQY